jgi:hypothetical protein
LYIDSFADSAFSDNIFACFERGTSSLSSELSKKKSVKLKEMECKRKEEDNYDMDSMSSSSVKSLDGLFEG